MSLIDEAREVKDWINSDDDPCDTGDLEPELVLQMCNHILAKPKKSKKTAGVWQITEERKAAIDRGLQFLEWSYAKNSAHDTKEQIAVLWAMLDEDTHDKP
ncbi:MAG: hypothetical protein WC343_14795 [Bacilli bacterium]|jgi:hypothetical protein